MPNMRTNHISNTDRPLVRDPIPAEQTADLAPDDQRNAEAASLQSMHTALGQQADALDGEHGKKLEDGGYVSRAELEVLQQKHQAEMQSLMAVFQMFQKNDPRRGAMPSQDELARDQQIYESNLQELKASPKEPVYITPEPYEAEAMAAHDGQPLFRVVQLNSVQALIPVGRIVQVPYQIAEVLRHSQEGRSGSWRKNTPLMGAPILINEAQPAQDLESIPRPERRPWAESAGRSGTVGQGEFRAFSGGPAVPLDQR